MIKSLQNQKASANQLPPLIRGQNEVGCTTREKSEILAESIENQCTTNGFLADDEYEEDVVQYCVTLQSSHSPCNLRRTTLHSLPSNHNKTPGNELITTNQAVKRMPKKAIVKVLQILNACFILNYFLDKWKTAVINTILKPGKEHAQPENHQPISLLPTCSKILEKIILSKLLHKVNELDLCTSARILQLS